MVNAGLYFFEAKSSLPCDLRPKVPYHATESRACRPATLRERRRFLCQRQSGWAGFCRHVARAGSRSGAGQGWLFWPVMYRVVSAGSSVRARACPASLRRTGLAGRGYVGVINKFRARYRVTTRQSNGVGCFAPSTARCAVRWPVAMSARTGESDFRRGSRRQCVARRLESHGRAAAGFGHRADRINVAAALPTCSCGRRVVDAAEQSILRQTERPPAIGGRLL